MAIRICDLSKDHPLVAAAVIMAEAYTKHTAMAPALEDVHKQCPLVTPDCLIALWVGIDVMGSKKRLN
ncbi:hypothetical protein [Pseudoalteromonas ruthenica]|uniref:hypothetical protein n=1 Tax=Pseudoalteromonas ruthenica TaxID=151081 RepID=UPI00241F6026|nr:hypothetical protein [Pseudoalteromonas ruthenica]|tara:strand:- start:15193 stop:15396 length:204 start_codon:yes stop_codon:yes gene_type:complete